MTEDKKVALRNSMAGKKVSELTAEERTLYDAEFKYNFASHDNKSITAEKLKNVPDFSTLPSTVDFLAKRI